MELFGSFGFAIRKYGIRGFVIRYVNTGAKGRKADYKSGTAGFKPVVIHGSKFLARES